jgi:GT2 family glycosyltransferase
LTTSVVVLSLRPGDWLEESLRSVLDAADEVVLVDNGSESGTAAVIGRRLGVSVVRSDRNLGFAAGVNLGVSRCSGDIVALLNDDAVAGPGWLARAADVLSVADVAAVTPKVLYRDRYREVHVPADPWSSPGDARVLGVRPRAATVDGIDVLARLTGPGVHRLEIDQDGDRWRWTKPAEPIYVPVRGPAAEVCIEGERYDGPERRLVNKAGSFLAADGILGDRGDHQPDDGRYDDAGEHFFASGTAMVFRSEVFARVGELAEPFFAYFEDADWSWRARLAGLRILYDPEAVVEHRQSATSGGWEASWVRQRAPANHGACLLRNAPLAQAAEGVRRHLRDSRDDGARRAVLRQVPWALATRPTLARGWRLRPQEVWDRWAGAQDPVGQLTPPGAAPASGGPGHPVPGRRRR